MKPDDPNVGQVLAELTRQSRAEMNAARRYAEMPKIGTSQRKAENICPEHLITIRQAAELLRVSMSSIRVWSNKGLLPCEYHKGQKFFHPDAIVKAFNKMDFARNRI